MNRDAATGPRLETKMQLSKITARIPTTRAASLAAIVCACAALAGAASAAAAPAAVGTPMPLGRGANWNLIMNDDFNGDSLNQNLWSPFRPGGPIFNLPFNPNLESARYSPQNVSVSNGNARLTVTSGAGRRYPYLTGVMQTAWLFNYTYGYIEARVKFPRCSGCWPAFWMLQQTTDPKILSETEVDIFELFGTQYFRHPYFNFHWNTFGAETGIQRYGRPNIDYTRGYHTFGLLWERGMMRVYVDGHPGPAMTGTLVPDVPMYPIMDLAVERGLRPHLNSQMLVDYVRVWQRP
jgi:beta-glucanase (GH16 family)